MGRKELQFSCLLTFFQCILLHFSSRLCFAHLHQAARSSGSARCLSPHMISVYCCSQSPILIVCLWFAVRGRSELMTAIHKHLEFLNDTRTSQGDLSSQQTHHTMPRNKVDEKK